MDPVLAQNRETIHEEMTRTTTHFIDESHRKLYSRPRLWQRDPARELHRRHFAIARSGFSNESILELTQG
jgi:hypothetical protein